MAYLNMEITNQLLYERLNNLIEANHEAHNKIDDHLTRLNGSVIKLKTWRSFISGGLAIITAIVIPMALMVFSKFLGG